MHVTKQLSEALVGFTFFDLPTEVITVAKRILLDGLAVAVAGAHEDGPRIAAEHVKELGGAPLSTVIAHGFKTSPVSAAYVNGVAMHVLDYEPMWSPPTHATSPTLPTVLALAEREGCSGREVLAAFVKACEVQGRLRLASHQYEPGQLKYHPPGVVGVLGSAVAAAHLLNFSVDQLRNALGIAASRAGGVMANVGTMTKATHCGWAAAAGLDAALLARRGFTGNPDVIEAPNGYAEVFFGREFEPQALLAFGQSYRMLEPGFAIKMFPSQYATHFAITAALDLRQQIADLAAIQTVHITTPLMPYVNRPQPRTGLDGKFSFQYTTAAALLDGTVTVQSFTNERRFRADMEHLLPVIGITQTERIPGEMEKMWVDLEVQLADGQQLAVRCNGPRGFWGRPLTRAEHLVKVRDCLGARLSSQDVERCIELAEGLDELGADGVRELMALVSA
ncbi:MAG: MmgE/PrpD family protein [Deltaproteobacteria bacterium]|nr:MmgE/PrpD family protein [Deltaproteobacteria bacterium]